MRLTFDLLSPIAVAMFAYAYTIARHRHDEIGFGILKILHRPQCLSVALP